MRALHGLSELVAVSRQLDVVERASELCEEEHARSRRSTHDDRMGDVERLEADDEIALDQRSRDPGSRAMLAEIHSELPCRANRLWKRGCAIALERAERVHDDRKRRTLSAKERRREWASGAIRRTDERHTNHM